MKRMKETVFVMLLLLICSSAHAGSSLVQEKAPDFRLADQFDRFYSRESFSGTPLVLIASDKEGREQNRQWRDLISNRYGSRVFMIGVADLRKVPFFLKGFIKRDLQKDRSSIMLDWKGELFTAYGLAQHVSNIIVIDRKGYVRYLRSGGTDPDAVDDLFRQIDGVLEGP